jgi:hypothetical protein
MLVRNVTDRLCTIILIAGMSLSLYAQQDDRAPAALDRALAAGQMDQARQALEEMLAREP